MKASAELSGNGRLPSTSLLASIDALYAAHTSRDRYTVEHEERAAALVVGIGSLLGLKAARLEVLRLAALVHDIGKISVPAEILARPGALTDVEYALIKQHAETGFRILEKLQSPLPLAEIAYQHHERLDGSGYPRGLSGNEIMLEARILAVADVFDAMISDRGYRAGLPHDFVLAELAKMAGHKLDADAVEACRHFVLSGSGRIGAASVA